MHVGGIGNSARVMIGGLQGTSTMRAETFGRGHQEKAYLVRSSLIKSMVI